MQVKRCLFTYESLENGERNYSPEGLRQLHPKLAELKEFPHTNKEILNEAQRLAGKISIQGVQPKLSVQLSLKDRVFRIVERGGTYIVKPQTSNYPELPENEDLTMQLASIAGIEIPWHGLIKCEDGKLAYVVKRFDRKGKGAKVAQEDFAQLLEASRTTKYEATMEQIAGVVDQYCTFKSIEWPKLFKRVVFSFLVGNEDMHLKNFSLITDEKGRHRLSPAYDLLNTTVAAAAPEEELALSMGGKKRGFKRRDFLEYAREALFIKVEKANREIDFLLGCEPQWRRMVKASFLSKEMKNSYLNLLGERLARLSIEKTRDRPSTKVSKAGRKRT